jgi:hypothetical protein
MRTFGIRGFGSALQSMNRWLPDDFSIQLIGLGDAWRMMENALIHVTRNGNNFEFAVEYFVKDGIMTCAPYVGEVLVRPCYGLSMVCMKSASVAMSRHETVQALNSLDGAQLSDTAEATICLRRYSPPETWTAMLERRMLHVHRHYYVLIHRHGFHNAWDRSCGAVNVTVKSSAAAQTETDAKTYTALGSDRCRISDDDAAVVELSVPKHWQQVSLSKIPGSVGRLTRDVLAPISQIRKSTSLASPNGLIPFSLTMSGLLPGEGLQTTYNGKELKRVLVVFIAAQGCTLMCYSQGVGQRAPITAIANTVLFPPDVMEPLFTAPANALTAPASTACDRYTSSNRLALLAHPGCLNTGQLVYVEWSVLSKMFISSSVIRSRLMSDIRAMSYDKILNALTFPCLWIAIVVAVGVVEGLLDRPREAVLFPIYCTIIVVILIFFFGMDLSVDMDFTEFAGIAKLVGICVLAASAYNVVHVKPFP